MVDFINNLLGINLMDTFGEYFASCVAVLFSVASLEFFIQVFMVFWRWLFHDK